MLLSEPMAIKVIHVGGPFIWQRSGLWLTGDMFTIDRVFVLLPHA